MTLISSSGGALVEVSWVSDVSLWRMDLNFVKDPPYNNFRWNSSNGNKSSPSFCLRSSWRDSARWTCRFSIIGFVSTFLNSARWYLRVFDLIPFAIRKGRLWGGCDGVIGRGHQNLTEYRSYSIGDDNEMRWMVRGMRQVKLFIKRNNDILGNYSFIYFKYLKYVYFHC